MTKQLYISLLCLLPAFSELVHAQDGLRFSGQVSSWALYNGGLELPAYLGGRYLPQLNYELHLKEERLIDFEASSNLNGSFGFHPFDTLHADGTVKPYRLWGRYSGRQYEIRIGLQKINFGSANLLRPLMWFDSVDPRDPLNLTDGVWAALGRYYFLNNANLWFWILYGNEDPRGWDLAGSKLNTPEFGGRFQVPIPAGEAALSFHHRVSDTRDLAGILPALEKVQENRVGFDMKLDLLVGTWLEASWVNNSENLGKYSNQALFNAGLDYTFGLGNGLFMIFEQLVATVDQKPFAFENTTTFSLLSLSYPLGLFSNIQGIMYYDWDDSNVYNFINLQRDFTHFSLYLMAFWNPENYRIPLQNEMQNLYAGKGIQLMFVINH